MKKLNILTLILLISISYHNGISQYFGKNKPSYTVFDYDVIETNNYDIYYTFKNDSLLKQLANLSEYWCYVHSKVFDDSLYDNNPVIFYESHPDFQQTNASFSYIDVGVGGFTDYFKQRVVMPVSTVYSQTNHVLGHELVHAFQFNTMMTDSITMKQMAAVPLWMIEGMAEYLSIGSVDPYTAIWMRDDILNKQFPSISDLTKDPKYNPYRYGQAFWTFVGRTYGDSVIVPIFKKTALYGFEIALDSVLNINSKTLSGIWNSASKLHFERFLTDTIQPIIGKKILSDDNSGSYNLSPAISPNGKIMAFYSERILYNIDLFLTDVETGKIIYKLSSHVQNNEVDAFNFLESSGCFSPDSKKFAYIIISKGKNKLIIVDIETRKIQHEIQIPTLKTFSTPQWSPDGESILLTGLKTGINNIYIYDLNKKELLKITNDNYSYLQPSWSNNGKYIVVSTDKEYIHGKPAHVTNPFDIQIIDLNTGSNQILNIFPGACNVNPFYTSDDESILFLSDRDGFRNLYRYSISEKKVYQLTDYYTGITGMTILTPAFSVSSNDEIVYNYYRDHKFDVYLASLKEFKEKEVDKNSINYDAATLPPLKRLTPGIIDSLHKEQPKLMAKSKIKLEEQSYKSQFELDYIFNSGGFGASGGRFGTQLAGSISALFSDIVGNNVFFANIAINGEIYDFGGQFAYINQKRKLKWGGSISHIPYIIPDRNIVVDTINIYGVNTIVWNEQWDLIRIFETGISTFGYLPFSTRDRIEGGISFSRYYYRWERYNYYFDEFNSYGSYKEILDPPKGSSLFKIDEAYVYDNSTFGLTSPLRGTRLRIGTISYLGSMNFISTLIDVRKYFYMQPFSLAFRFFNQSRFGINTIENLIYPLYIGEPWLIRGYEITSTQGKRDFINLLDINQLIGTRMIVFNTEFRIPLTGPKNISLIKLKTFYTDISLFLDAGLIWDQTRLPDIKWTTKPKFDERIPLISSGISLRINMLGYVVIEPFLAIPFQNGGFNNLNFGLNFTPGW